MKRLSLNDIQQYSSNYHIICSSEHYVNSNLPLHWICHCGNPFVLSFERLKHNKHKGCPACCKKVIKYNVTQVLGYSHDFVAAYIKATGCVLLSVYQQDYTKHLNIQCKCGEIFQQSFQTFKNSKKQQCPTCSNKIHWTTEKVKRLIKKRGGKLVGQYQPTSPISVCCSQCHSIFSVRLMDYIRKGNSTCPSCSHKNAWNHNSKKVTIKQVIQYVKKNSKCELLSTNINSINDPLNFKCICGKTYKQSFATFRNRKHHECGNCSTSRRTGISLQSLELLNDKQLLIKLHTTNKMNMHQIAERVGVSLQTVCNYMHIHDISIQSFPNSKGEVDIVAELRKQVPNLMITTNSKAIISPYELDIYLPEYHFAIEFNGIYWHSEAINNDIQYHKRKFDMCQAQNITLLTIFEDEWYEHKQIVVNTILNKIHKQQLSAVYARNTIIKEVDLMTRIQFLDKYHIQGNGRGSICFGAWSGKQLVACMLFTNFGKGCFLLNRFCSSVPVIGAFSKLLMHFKKNIDWTTIHTFADKRWSWGKVYEINGFTKQKDLPPDYYYVKNGTRYHKFGFRRNKLKQKLDVFDYQLTEKQNCLNNGYYRLWDCGKIKFIMNQRLVC